MLTEIPNLLNYDYREATSELEKLGFVVDKTFADSDVVAADCVMQISPSPGEKLPAGATVYLSVFHMQTGAPRRGRDALMIGCAALQVLTVLWEVFRKFLLKSKGLPDGETMPVNLPLTLREVGDR